MALQPIKQFARPVLQGFPWPDNQKVFINRLIPDPYKPEKTNRVIPKSTPHCVYGQLTNYQSSA